MRLFHKRSFSDLHDGILLAGDESCGRRLSCGLTAGYAKKHLLYALSRACELQNSWHRLFAWKPNLRVQVSFSTSAISRNPQKGQGREGEQPALWEQDSPQGNLCTKQLCQEIQKRSFNWWWLICC